MAQRPWTGGDTPVDTSLDRSPSSLRGPGLSGFSRRGFLRASGAGALALSSTSLLAACGTEGTKQSADTCKSTDLSAKEKELVFSNWPLYMDEDGKKYPTLDDFQKQSGIKVTYNTDVNGNNEFFAKVRNQLGACEPVGRDIFVLTDWMAARLVGLGWLQELDKANMPNVEANLVDTLKNPSWDPDRNTPSPGRAA